MMTSMTMIEQLVKDIYLAMSDDDKFVSYINNVWGRYSLIWRIAVDKGYYNPRKRVSPLQKLNRQLMGPKK